jgi:hypothetical protein
MIKQFGDKTFKFDEVTVKNFFYPINNTPFEGFSESIDAFKKGDLMTVINIHIKNLTGHPANDKQRQKILSYLCIAVVE